MVSDNQISGTLKYVTGYTGFSSVTSEQSGNYLALKFEATPEPDSITVEVVNGTKGPVLLDEDKNIVLLIKDKDSQSIKVTVEKDDETIVKTYALSGLILEPAVQSRQFKK